MTKVKSIWFLDFYTSCHPTNNQYILVEKIHLKTWDFTIAKRQIIWSEGVKKVQIALTGGLNIQLEEIALIPKCESHFISLGQLQNNKIIYYNNSIFLQNKKPIAYAGRNQNLFIPDLATLGKII